MFLRFKDTGHAVLSEEQTHFLHLHRHIIENLKSMAAIVAEIICLSMLRGGFYGTRSPPAWERLLLLQ